MNASATKYTVGQMITGRFPALNKNGDLAENDAAIAKKARDGRCKVQKVIEVPDFVYDVLGDTLMADNPMWEKIGGQDADLFDDVTFEQIARDKVLMARYRHESWTNVVVVTDGARTFLVNTEGYDYARYAGRVVQEVA
jgi:hypothetical protein